MTLAVRLALTIVLVAIPLIAVPAIYALKLERRAAEIELRDKALLHMEIAGSESCERAPAEWPPELGQARAPAGDPRAARVERTPSAPHAGPNHTAVDGRYWLHAYGDADLRAVNPRAPALDPDLVAEFRAATDGWAGRALDLGGEPAIEVLVRIATGGPCAVILARDAGPELGFIAQAGQLLAVPAATCALVLLLVLVAIAPVVRRVRRLTREVRATAADRYDRHVTIHGTDEVAELARAFNESSAEIRSRIAAAEQREQALRAFVDNTAHDVMIPLTVLQGHLLELGRAGADPAVLRAALEEAHYISAIVRNLDTMAKLDAGATDLRRHPVSLDQVVERAAERYRPIAQQRGIDLDYAVPPESLAVVADVTLVEQALGNLVDNAIRHNTVGSHVVLLLEPVGDTEFTLTVLDDGPGIPEEDRQRLLERGARGSAARRRHPGGRGLGLSIAREVAREHGWRLDLSTSEHGGLRAELRGPRRASTRPGS